MSNEPVVPRPEKGAAFLAAPVPAPALEQHKPGPALLERAIETAKAPLARARALKHRDRIALVCTRCDLISHVGLAALRADTVCPHCGQPMFQGRVFDLHGANFDLHVQASHVPTAVVFWAPWCKPCHSLLARAERAARALEPRLRFARVNTDEERGLVARFGVRGIPTLVLFKGGAERVRRIGNVDLESIASVADD